MKTQYPLAHLSPSACKLSKGLTLIEILVVLAILSILAAYAYPGYSDYVIKAKRAQAISALNEASAILQRNRGDTGSYLWEITSTSSDGIPQTSNINWEQRLATLELLYVPKGVTTNPTYTISISNLDHATFTLTATLNSAVMEDPSCHKLIVDESTKKTALTEAGSESPSASYCWNE